MSSLEVVLEYKREVNQSTGRIVLRNGVGDQVFFTFEKSEFEPMLYKFAEALQANPESKGTIQRTDRPGLVPYELDAKVIELFRTDPVSAVTSMSTPYGSPSTVVQRVREERTPIETGLRVGYDVLADAFGENLYCKAKDGKMECPGCGLWNDLTQLTRASVTSAARASAELGHLVLSCRNPRCPFHAKYLPVEMGKRWAAISTATLLESGAQRFYFPRAWNDGRSWLSRRDLNAKYIAFEKEKEL